jgi:hypothetical protein
MTFIYNVNGVDTEFSADDLMNLPEGATLWIVRRSNNRRVCSPIHDFTMMKDGSDYKEELLVAPITDVCHL